MNQQNLSTHGKCRFCGNKLNTTFADFAMSPICNDVLYPDQLNQMEPHYPLHVYVCNKCFLVQLEEFVSPEKIFNDYTYFSSYSEYWLKHVKEYVNTITDKFSLNKNSYVVELASNDGYLLQYFLEKGIPVLGVEPASTVAAAAEKKGVKTLIKFFGEKTANDIRNEYGSADLLLGNNVLAHVPDINDFVGGMKILLKPDGIITMEFPHLMRLIEDNQFDTIYHEHFSYLSFSVVSKIFEDKGLNMFDVEQLETHGGSLRIYAKHIENESLKINKNVKELLNKENEAGIYDMKYYNNFKEKVIKTKRDILSCLIDIKNKGNQIAGYGAPGKGNTLLNYCGIKTDFINFTVDRNPHKQNKFLPGSLIPIYSTEKIKEEKPDYVFILPWNLKEEIMEQLSYIREWDGKFIVPIPEVKIY
ncbi:MAG: methyltransferase domain-containing protein [Ignavibacteriae bacterium]|nr:methyltransferase domain-containing protein [Ignavibacteriota bacterium]NOH00334.1 methyltransferase domain-containing protein [Ignavibacteriota bacterium]